MTMARTSRDRRKAFLRGHLSEYYAAIYLLFKGYRIKAMRFRTKSGEVDIIARKGDLVAFVEVKARRITGDAIFAVDPTTQRRIRNASLAWIARQPDAAILSYRYDIVAVTPWSRPQHFSDAF
jgi:putative endonuclease